jgi:hypothetical protein
MNKNIRGRSIMSKATRDDSVVVFKVTQANHPCRCGMIHLNMTSSTQDETSTELELDGSREDSQLNQLQSTINKTFTHGVPSNVTHELLTKLKRNVLIKQLESRRLLTQLLPWKCGRVRTQDG